MNGKPDEFRNKYRNADMLLIDDIQFISGKEATEESFFHIFNELRDADRQIALTSNCPPHSIPLIEDRLRSRLEWGFRPAFSRRTLRPAWRFWRPKPRKKESTLTPDVLEFIAEHIKQNIRELEGSLNRVVAYAKLLRAVVTPELASEALEDIATRQAQNSRRPLPCCWRPWLTISTWTSWNLKGSKRDKQTTLARQIAMYLLREQTDFSLSRIGRELGGRQPIIVSQAHKKIAENIAGDQNLRQTVAEICRR